MTTKHSNAVVWIKIRKHLTQTNRFGQPQVVFDPAHKGLDRLLKADTTTVYISKTAQKFRLKSHLDWAYYTPAGIAQAFDTDSLELYHQQQLSNPNSDPNDWKRSDEEQELKGYYAARAGRASLI